MVITLDELARLTNSTISGDKNIQLKAVSTLEEAGEGDISFVSNPKYKKLLKGCGASAVIMSSALAEDYSGNALINDDPYLTFAKIVRVFHAKKNPIGLIHTTAIVDQSSSISASANIGANVVIEENVHIGDGVSIGANSFIGKGSSIQEGVFIHANVSIYSETQIGKNSLIHSSAVIGADGFGFAPQKDKSWYKILQVGNVVIGSDVEIGASTTIDRAALGSTIIGNGVKIDNQIQIGHNVKIGDHSIFAAGTLIAGSTTIGKYCQVAGAVAIAGHLQITDNVISTGKSMVINSVNKAGVYSSGIAADENKKWRRNAIRFSQLDDMAKTVKRLEAQVDKLEKG